MTGKQKTAIVAIGTVLVSFVSIVTLLILTDGAKLVPRGIRFTMTCFFSFYLFRRAGWSRWVVGILSALAAITSVVGFFSLGKNGAPLLSFFGVWLGLMGVFYAWVAYTLLIDKTVAGYFRSSEPP